MNKREEIVFDLEISKNYFLCGFKKVKDGKVLQIDTKTSLTKDQRKKIISVLRKVTIIGFNSSRYDIPMLLKALEGVSTMTLFKMSETIIKENLPNFITMNRFDVQKIDGIDHFDLMPVQPSLFVSLKSLGVRLNSKRLQELPYAYDKILSDTEIDVIRKYNINDLDVTIDLYNEVKHEVVLRVEMGKVYGIDLRSKSGAQVATAVLLKMTDYKGKAQPIPKGIKYKAPSCITFKTDHLQELLLNLQSHIFEINKKNGQPIVPEWLKKNPIVIGNTKYQVGVGGLHDKQKKTVKHSSETQNIIDIDVVSFYPSMMLEFDFFPKIKDFAKVYKDIYVNRLKAKKEGDKFTSNSLKLVLNSSFGLMGSMYSKFYSPETMIHVTITGQLLLLMLIEELESNGIEVFYGNTDGITAVVSDLAVFRAIVFDWELTTGMIMEENFFKAVYIRDVNAFINITEDGDIKSKGVYAEPTLSKNNEYPIVFDSIKAFLKDGVPMLQTLTECKDFTRFISGRTVSKGGMYKGEYLGKVVRFYFAEGGEPIFYKNIHGNMAKVATTDGCKPIMDLPDTIPADLDYHKYLELADKHLEALGYGKQ